MADVVLTDTTVVKASADTLTAERLFGEDADGGLGVYKKTSSNQYHIADCVTSEATALAEGILLNDVLESAYGQVVYQGLIKTGTAKFVAWTDYYLSEAGLLMPALADFAANDWLTYMGYAISTTEFYVRPHATGKKHP